jgi:hypothetical protein
MYGTREPVTSLFRRACPIWLGEPLQIKSEAGLASIFSRYVVTGIGGLLYFTGDIHEFV